MKYWYFDPRSIIHKPRKYFLYRITGTSIEQRLKVKCKHEGKTEGGRSGDGGQCPAKSVINSERTDVNRPCIFE
jgi:hypothetical protein